MARLREREQVAVLDPDNPPEFSRPVEIFGWEGHEPIPVLLVNKATGEVSVDGGNTTAKFRNIAYLDIILSLSESAEKGLTNEEVGGVVKDTGNSYFANPGWDYIINLRKRLEADPANPQIFLTDRTTGRTKYYLRAKVVVLDPQVVRRPGGGAMPEEDNLGMDPQEYDSIRRTLAGDLERFGELYERYSTEIFRYIDGRVRNMHVAQDLTSKVFLSAFDAMKTGQYTVKGPFVAWIKRIAHNFTINYFRDSQKQPSLYLNDALFKVEEEEDMAGDADRQKVVTRVREALEKLPPLYQIVLHKHFWEERSFAEIAEELSIKTPGAAKALAYRAKLKLKEVLSQMEEAA